MNRADRMLEVLLDGEPHSRAELHAAGGYYMTNNAAAELRARHYNVVQHRQRIDGAWVYYYRLGLNELPESDARPIDWGRTAASDSGSAGGDPARPDLGWAPLPVPEVSASPAPSFDEQLTLLEAA